MEYSQEELTKICPTEIGDYIDEIILPSYANGFNTAEMIASSMVYNALSRLEIANVNHLEYYQKHSSTALIDSFIGAGINKKILVAYIQTAFDSWESYQ